MLHSQPWGYPNLLRRFHGQKLAEEAASGGHPTYAARPQYRIQLLFPHGPITDVSLPQ